MMTITRGGSRLAGLDTWWERSLPTRIGAFIILIIVLAIATTTTTTRREGGIIADNAAQNDNCAPSECSIKKVLRSSNSTTGHVDDHDAGISSTLLYVRTSNWSDPLLPSNSASSSLMYLWDSVESVVSKSLARVYAKAPSPKRIWCNEGGLYYVKVPKTASSTVAGAIMRIARKQKPQCAYQNIHVRARTAYGGRDRNSTFLIGSVRDPALRQMSYVWFHKVTRMRMAPTAGNVMQWMRQGQLRANADDGTEIPLSPGTGGFQLSYLTLQERPRGWSAFEWVNETAGIIKNLAEVQARVERVLHDYDFIIVAERLDESFVVLHYLLGVELGDLVVMDSKVSGGYYYFRNRCIQIQRPPEVMDPQIQEYLSSSAWYGSNYGDYLLHAAASASLDRTIDELGREGFLQKLGEFRTLKETVLRECAAEAVYPCSSNGTVQPRERTAASCYKRDWGCGYPCVDRVILQQRESSA